MNANLNQKHATHALTSRFYETGHDLQHMVDLLMEARSQTSDWRYSHIGELLFNFFMVICHLNPHHHIRLWHEDHEKLVGYAMLGEDPSFDCHVLPGYEWSGIEVEALAWAEGTLRELRHRDAEKWSGPLVSGARQDDIKRIAFLDRHGFQYRGEFAEVNMIRSLDEPLPAVILPAGCHVRALRGTDEIPARAAIQRDVWHPWTVGAVSDDDYAHFMQLPGYHRELDIVTVAEDGVIAAYVNGWIDPVNKIGDLGPVGARQAYRRRGLTRAALLESLHRMKAHGMNRVCISTGISNTAAQHLYASVGFNIVNQYFDYVKTASKTG